MKKYVPLFCLLALPNIVEAFGGLQDFLRNVVRFINVVVVPALFALAFLFFIVNVLRYFIIGGADEASQKKAKSLALWGLAAFVLMIGIWGIVNILVSDFGFNKQRRPCPDFFPTCI